MGLLKEYVREDARLINGYRLDNITDWIKMDIIDLVNVVHDRDGWRKSVSKSSVLIPPYDFRVTGLKVYKPINQPIY